MTADAKKMLKNFDIDGDGTFSLDEFMLFLVLLSMPLKDMAPIFALMDADGSGELDKTEFMDAVNGLVALAGHSAGSAVGRTSLSHTDRKCAPYTTYSRLARCSCLCP